MGIGTGAAIAIGAGALIGGIAGSQKDKVESSTKSESGVTLGSETDLEKQGTRMTGEGLSALEEMVNAGPGQADVSAAYNQTNSLASLLNDFSKTGGAPGQQDILQSQENANLQFAPYQLAIDQSFKEEQLRAKQMAAQLGRPVNDPYIQTMLSKEKMNQQAMLGAQKGAFMNQDARGTAMNRLGFTSQLTDVRNGLASQAMANRQALLSLGQGVQQSERNFRLGTATRWGTQTGEQTSGGGASGGLMGGLMGAGSMAGIMGGMPGMGGGGDKGKSGGNTVASQPGASMYMSQSPAPQSTYLPQVSFSSGPRSPRSLTQENFNVGMRNGY